MSNSEKLRFSDAQVGDDVYCRLRGIGKIENISSYITVSFVSIYFEGKYLYDFTGRPGTHFNEPTLFYRDETSNYLENRPLPKLDLNKLPVDTKLLVQLTSRSTTIPRYYAGNGYWFDDGRNSFTALGEFDNSRLINAEKAILAEDVIIDGVLFPKGTSLL